ncbi:MAG: alpha/beta fold hydrolase [Lysobacterales bacterium]
MDIKRRQWVIGIAAASAALSAGCRTLPAPPEKTHAELNRYARRSGPMPTPFLPVRGYANGPYGQIHFRDTGRGIPLVLCHQAPQTSRQFTNVYEPLMRRGIRAIGVDTPGFGESDPTPFVPAVEDWAVVVPAVLDHLGIRQANVLGHHTGAMVATEVALQYPSRVRRLIINGPLPVTEARRRKYLDGVQEREIDFVYKADGSHLQASFATRYRMYGEGADPQTITRYTAEKFQGYAPFWTGHHAAFIYDHSASIKKIQHETLILTNTGDMINEDARVAKEMRPDFGFVELEGGGVDIVDQQPEEWADAVEKFLKG